MYKTLWLLLLIAMLPACQLIPLQARDQMVSAASKYCAMTTSVERQILRDGVNADLAKKDIVICGIKCPGEPAPKVPACQ